MGKERKGSLTFYEYMQHFYKKDCGRCALAHELYRLAPRHKELREIDSLCDLMIAARVLKDPDARDAATGSLWCEYCTVAGRPVAETDN